MSETPTPPDDAPDQEATELLRLWVADEELHVTLQPDAFPDPDTWGLLLADVVRNLADAIREQEGRGPEETIRLIRARFNAELDAPRESAADG